MKKRGFYIDPLWIAFLMVGIAVGLMVASLAPAKAVEAVKHVPFVNGRVSKATLARIMCGV